MFDHIGFPVRDFARSRAFYDQALAPLGYSVQMEVTAEQTGGDAHVGYGANGRPQFWIGDGEVKGDRVHVAFVARDRAAVDAFYKAAMESGGTDNGPPGIREHYHPNYYGAYVLDPDGNNIEAVCHLAE
ncbi:VOC family protein [Labrys okinawensis]|uniref:VOC family protein n=1 Tax=Labrys okinawensis TaxID=346911 RepID=UPI0039BD8C31